jgi:ABC-type sulfate/molybdate transport systems ATPase subunit
MNLLKDVAKDRLVVMVTHNPELAEQYATRIVNLRDGVIRSDSDPFVVDETAEQPAVYKTMGRASMSFATSQSEDQEGAHPADLVRRLDRHHRHRADSIGVDWREHIHQ